MKPRLLMHFVREIQSQYQSAKVARGLLQASLSPGGPDLAFFAIHAFLSHVANISKLLWPAPRGKPTSQEFQQAMARGDQLRSELNVSNTSGLASRKARDRLEHFDERLDDWVRMSPHHNSVDTSIGNITQAIAGLDPGDYIRNYDPDTDTFLFRGEQYDLGAIERDLDELAEETKRWMSDHGYRSSV